MTALNTPTIWTPRSGPWWRLPRWAGIAQYAKKLQFKGGKLALKNGKPIITEEGNPCCCGGGIEEGDPCQHCETTPAKLQLTLSGVALGRGCYVGGGSQCNHSWVIDDDDLVLNVSVTLHQKDHNPCFWTAIEPIPEYLLNDPNFSARSRVTTGCFCGAGEEEEGLISYWVTKGSDGFSVNVMSTSPSQMLRHLLVFVGYAIGTDCMEPATADNISTSPSTFGARPGYGGVATVEPI